MVEIKDIQDGAAFAAWLGKEPSREKSFVAIRAVLRVAPILWKSVDPDNPSNSRVALHSVRACLASHSGTILTNPSSISVIATTDQDLLKVNQASPAFTAVANCTRGFIDDPYVLSRMISAAIQALKESPRSLSEITSLDEIDVLGAVGELWGDVQNDIRQVSSGTDPRLSKLWAARYRSDIETWEEVSTSWRAAGAPWDFFADWYDGLLRGDPPDWPLLEQIALIASEDWDAGPERIAERIDLIREKLALKQQAAQMRSSIEAELAAPTAASAEYRSHNQPPEIIEEAEREQLRLILSRIVEVEEELGKPDPSPSRLRDLALWFLSLVKECGLYVGKKLDLIVDTTIKWGIPVAGTWLVANSAPVQEFGLRLLDFIAKLPTP